MVLQLVFMNVSVILRCMFIYSELVMFSFVPIFMSLLKMSLCSVHLGGKKYIYRLNCNA